MTTATATITGTITVPSQAKAAKVFVKFAPYTENLRLVHPDGVVEGWELVTIDPTAGTWTIDLPLTGQSGVSPAGALWQAQERATNGAIETTVFDLTGDIDWKAIVPVTDLPFTPSLLQQAEGYATDAESARDAAQTAETGAQVAQAAAQAVPTSNDTIIAGRIGDTTPSASRAALLASFADLASLPEVLAIKNGVKADSTTGLDGTDDSAALNTLITAVSAFGGGRIKLPAGALRLDTSLVPKSGVIVEGAGKLRTILFPKQYGFNAGTLSTGAPLTDFHARDLSINGTNQTSTYKAYHGQYHLRCSWVNLYIKNTQMTGLGPDFLRQCLIENVTTENTGLGNDGTQPGGNGIGIGGGGWTDLESFLVVGCHAINAKRYGIMAEGGATQVGGEIIGNTATACGGAGFGLGNGLGVLCEGNTAYANVGNGIEISSLTLSTNNPAGRPVVRGNTCHQNGGDGIAYIATGHRAATGHAQIIGNNSTENTGHGVSIAIDLSLVTSETQITGFKIDGNTLVQNGLPGLIVTTTGSNASSWVPIAWTIDNNISTRSGSPTAGPEFAIVANMKGCSISRNVFYHSSVSTSRPGIYVGFGGTAVTLTGCRIDGNTNANPGNVVLKVDAAATIDSTSTTNGNQPDAGTPAPKTVTTNYTASASDTTVLSNGATTINLPKPASAGAGREYTVKNISATVVTVRESASGSSFDNTTIDVLGQYASATYVSDGTQWWKKAAGAVISGSATLDFPSIVAGGIQELTVTVSGALAGEPVVLGAPSTIESGLIWSGFVSAANTVKIRLHNTTTGAVDPASATWNARVLR